MTRGTKIAIVLTFLLLGVIITLLVWLTRVRVSNPTIAELRPPPRVIATQSPRQAAPHEIRQATRQESRQIQRRVHPLYALHTCQPESLELRRPTHDHVDRRVYHHRDHTPDYRERQVHHHRAHRPDHRKSRVWQGHQGWWDETMVDASASLVERVGHQHSPWNTVEGPGEPEGSKESGMVEEPLPTGSSTFTVVSYNVRIDMDRSPHRWVDRKRPVLQNILRVHPSVICLQESTDKVRRMFAARLPDFGMVTATRSAASDEAVPILYDRRQWRLKRGGTMVMTEAGPAPCVGGACHSKTRFGAVTARHPRLLTYAWLESSAGEVCVYNTHFPLARELQDQCARQIASVLGSTETLPIVLTGDFNSHYDAAVGPNPIQTLLAAGLRDTLNLVPHSTFGSFHALCDDTPRLDFILYQQLELEAAAVSDFTYGSQRYRPSDHSLLHATFKFA